MSGKMTSCASCGRETARSARACPHCGAKQGIKGIRRVLNYAVGGFLILVVLAAFFRTERGTPACDSATSTDLLTQSFDQSQYARTRNLSAVEITDIGQKSVSDDTHRRACTATIKLNNANSLDLRFELSYRERDKSILLEFGKR